LHVQAWCCCASRLTLPRAQLPTPRVFGWTPKNEIGNGRWVMFGFLVGMLTEYATGVSFPAQIAQTVSYLGLWDFE
jgi:hypothetical protein